MLSVQSSHEVEEPPNVPRPIADPAAGGEAATLEHVPEETLRVIDQLFPRPTSGIAFLALLLRWANVRQYAHGLGEAHDVAVITVQSIRVLARLIGWSYETTHKYVVLFCALGLLNKRRANGMIELHFPLHRYTPPLSLAELDRLIIDARHKVAVCASRVKQRYLVLYGRSPSSFLPESSVPGTSTLLSGSGIIPSPLTELDATIHQLRELLQQHGTESFRPQLGEALAHLLHLRGLLALPSQHVMVDSGSLFRQQYEDTPSSVDSMATRKPTGDEQQVDSMNASSSEQSRLVTQQVDSDVSSLQQGRLVTQQVDSNTSQYSPEGRLSPQQVDSASSRQLPHSRLSVRKSTSRANKTGQESTFLAQQVDSLPKKVDSLDVPSESTSLNVNVSIQTVIDSLNVNVRSVATYLQEAFGEERQKRGYYHNLYRDHKDAQVWLVAALETLIGIHRTRTIRQPGKYFYDRCVVLHRDGIPPELHGLVQQYGSLSLSQLVEKIGGDTVSSPGKAPLAHPTPQHSGSSSVSKPTNAIELHIPRERDHVGMSQQDVRQVYHLVTAAVPGLRLRAYRQADASYALLLDDGLRQPHQTWMYSLQECEERLGRMKKVRDLFQTNECSNT